MKSSKAKTTLLVILLSLLVCCSSAIAQPPAAYADSADVTVDNSSEHGYYASQIFAGSYYEQNGKPVLADVSWGSGIADPAAFVSALKSDGTIGGLFADVPAYDSSNPAASAIAVGKVIEDMEITHDSDTPEAHALLDQIARNLDSSHRVEIAPSASRVTLPDGYGYYVLQQSSKDGEAAQIAVLRIAGGDGLVIADKSSAPTLTQELAQEDVSTGEVLAWQRTITSDDTAQVRLTATMPDNVANQRALDYEMVFSLTSRLIPSRVISLSLVNGDSSKPITAAYASWHQVSKSYDGSGSGYSDDVPYSFVFYIDVDGMMADPAYDVNDDSLIVATFEVLIQGWDILGTDSIQTNAFVHFTSDAYGSINTRGSNGDDSAYSPGEIIRPSMSVNKTDRYGDPLPGARFVLYAVDAAGAETQVWNTEISQPDASTFNFPHLGDGRYVLREVSTPDDSVYALAKDVQFELHASFDESGDIEDYLVTDWDGNARSDMATSLSLAPANKTVSVNTSIINWRKGEVPIELPETGGIGSLIFYIIGGAIVLTAGSVLIARKRSQRKGIEE